MLRILLTLVGLACVNAVPFKSQAGSFIQNERIIGGAEVKDNKFAYQALFLTKGQNSCGGAIIAKDKILTTAYCCLRFDLKETDVIIGLKEMPASIPNKNKNKIGKISKNPISLDEDICVVTLKTPLTLDNEIAVIGLPTKNEQISGKVKVSGWGSTKGSSPYDSSKKLMYAELDIKERAECKKIFNQITDGVICAEAKGKDFCVGDKGGPLVKDKTLVGLASWGFGCGVDGYPGVYINVQHFLDWINAQ